MLLALLLIAGPLAGTGWAQTFPNRPPSGGVIVSDEIGLIRVEDRPDRENRRRPVQGPRLSRLRRDHQILAAHKAVGYPIERYAAEAPQGLEFGIGSPQPRHAPPRLRGRPAGAHPARDGVGCRTATGERAKIVDSRCCPRSGAARCRGAFWTGCAASMPWAVAWRSPMAPLPWWLSRRSRPALVLVGGSISLGRSGRQSWRGPSPASSVEFSWREPSPGLAAAAATTQPPTSGSPGSGDEAKRP